MIKYKIKLIKALLKEKVMQLQTSLAEIKKLFEEQNKAMEEQKAMREREDSAKRHLNYNPK